MVAGSRPTLITLGVLKDGGGTPGTGAAARDGPRIRFYRVPPGLLWGDFGLHLEGIWWGHRYAVVWPSVNPDSGLRYLWIDDTQGGDAEWGCPPPKVTDLPDLPAAWVARFGRPAGQPAPWCRWRTRPTSLPPRPPLTGVHQSRPRGA
jgi:hypothetical protein